MKLWKVLLEQQIGIPFNSDYRLGNFLRIDPDIRPCELLMMVLPYIWLDSARLYMHKEAVEGIRDRAMASGYQWIASLAAELLASAGVQKKNNTQIVDELTRSCGIIRMADMVQSREEWETGLRALISLADTKNEKGE